jgi:hypothetical protein
MKVKELKFVIWDGRESPSRKKKIQIKCGQKMNIENNVKCITSSQIAVLCLLEKGF